MEEPLELVYHVNLKDYYYHPKIWYQGITPPDTKRRVIAWSSPNWPCIAFYDIDTFGWYEVSEEDYILMDTQDVVWAELPNPKLVNYVSCNYSPVSNNLLVAGTEEDAITNALCVIALCKDGEYREIAKVDNDLIFYAGPHSVKLPIDENIDDELLMTFKFPFYPKQLENE